MSQKDFLKSIGLTNTDSEDLGSICTQSAKMEYAYYCSSFSCAGATKNEILKFTSTEWSNKCPDCGSLLHSKRMKLKQRHV